MKILDEHPLPWHIEPNILDSRIKDRNGNVVVSNIGPEDLAVFIVHAANHLRTKDRKFFQRDGQ